VIRHLDSELTPDNALTGQVEIQYVRTNLRFGQIVVLTLALGIGATTAIFRVVSLCPSAS
jgi:hypothetical protein